MKFNLNLIKTDKIFVSNSGKTVFEGGKSRLFPEENMEIQLLFAVTALSF